MQYTLKRTSQQRGKHKLSTAFDVCGLTWTSLVVNLVFGIKLEIMTTNYNAKHMKWVKLQQASGFRGILEASE